MQEIMFVSLLLLLCVTLAIPEASQATDSESEGLGKVVYLPKINLLADFHEKENRIYEPLPSECFTKKPLKSSSSKFDYYKSTKELYKSLATESSLSASLTSTFTLSATVSVATKSKSSLKTEVSGISLIKEALTEKIYVDKECLVNAKKSTLDGGFLDYLENLPLKIEKPWFHNSWRAYRTFLDKYGSHVITSMRRGSRFQQMVFAESSQSYSERDFQVKACVSAAGPTSVGKLGVSACSKIGSNEISKASKMSVSETRFVRGGLRATNSELANGETSAELIIKLMNEADEAPSPVQHTLMPISRILQSRFKPGSNNYIRATNLEYYYNGYLSYGCTYKTLNGVELQKFDYTKGSKEEYPEFECSIPKEGCHSDNDCYYMVGVWCNCGGRSCVRHKSEKQILGSSKETAYMNTATWDWKGCDWKVWGSVCACYNKDRNERQTVWSLATSSKDAGKHKAPGNTTYDEAIDSVTGQAERMATPNTAEDAAEHMAKHPIQTQLKEEEEEI